MNKRRAIAKGIFVSVAWFWRVFGWVVLPFSLATSFVYDYLEGWLWAWHRWAITDQRPVALENVRGFWQRAGWLGLLGLKWAGLWVWLNVAMVFWVVEFILSLPKEIYEFIKTKEAGERGIAESINDKD